MAAVLGSSNGNPPIVESPPGAFNGFIGTEPRDTSIAYNIPIMSLQDNSLLRSQLFIPGPYCWRGEECLGQSIAFYMLGTGKWEVSHCPMAVNSE